jgi:hypothetical protein
VADSSYQGYKPRPELIPITRARLDPAKPFDYIVQLNGDAPAPQVEASASMPFTGITADGHVVRDLYGLEDTGLPRSRLPGCCSRPSLPHSDPG